MGLSRKNFRLLQAAVVVVAIMLTALVGYRIKTTTAYEESGTVVFTSKQSAAQTDASHSLVQSLTTTGEAMVQALISQNSRALVRRAGGTAGFTATIVNFSNEDFPNYAYPLAALIVRGETLESVQTTFKVVIRMLRSILSHKQEQASVRKAQRITVSIIDVAGPLVERPSRIRAYAALGLLSFIGIGMSLIFTRRLLSNSHVHAAGVQAQGVGKVRPTVI